MNSKVKVLCVSDAGIYTGFSRVFHSIFENLPQDEYEIHSLAINYRGDPWKTNSNIYLYPAMLGGDLIGLGRFQSLYDKVQPDLIWILNDLWLIREYVSRMTDEQLAKTVIYFPVDAEGSDPDWIEKFELLGARVAYTQFGKREIQKLNPYLSVKIIPHGVDTTKFFPVDKDIVFSTLKGLDKNDFIVLDANRNQIRKRTDLGFKAFAKFAKDKPANVKFYCHKGLVDEGHDLIKMAARYDLTDRLIITSKNLSPGNGVPIERLNLIYNCAKIGLNTSQGEGFGLCNIEHAVTGAVQVVPNSSALVELYSDCGKLINIKDEYTYPQTLTIGKVIDADSAANILNELYESPKLLEDLSQKCYTKFTRPEYEWANISKVWDSVFKQVVK